MFLVMLDPRLQVVVCDHRLPCNDKPCGFLSFDELSGWKDSRAKNQL